ncbi:MAG: hypothetical protein RLZZ139_1314 [Cyanobacteriota bacterium]
MVTPRNTPLSVAVNHFHTAELIMFEILMECAAGAALGILTAWLVSSLYLVG